MKKVINKNENSKVHFNRKKSLTAYAGLCYSRQANGSLGFFFMPKIDGFRRTIRQKSIKSEVESCARKDHIGMYGVQAA